MVITRRLEKAFTGPFRTIYCFVFLGTEPEPAEPELAEPKPAKSAFVTEPLELEPAWLRTEPNRTEPKFTAPVRPSASGLECRLLFQETVTGGRGSITSGKT